jgi:hypothetical protein
MRYGNDWTDKPRPHASAIVGLWARNAYLGGELCGEVFLMTRIEKWK